ncbi:MAG: BON domain-containing protein [Nevskiaceae bacterium]|nr:MAG: BON domain-containing protein [Nevskiaceae bacterium]TBR74138.1 MAG: BON domain-containing protein [Nevskiaceae bacterium]
MARSEFPIYFRCLIASSMLMGAGAVAAAAPPASCVQVNQAGTAMSRVALSALAKRVQAKLLEAYGIKPSQVRVTDCDGVITLEGTVASGVISDQAKDAASRVPGVKEINDRLQVSKP